MQLLQKNTTIGNLKIVEFLMSIHLMARMQQLCQDIFIMTQQSQVYN